MNSPVIATHALLLACWNVEDAQLASLNIDCLRTPIAGRPLLQRAVEQLVDAGCTDITVAGGDNASDCEKLLGDGARFGVRIRHQVAADGPRPLARLAPAIAKLGPVVRVACTLTLDDGVLAGAAADATAMAGGVIVCLDGGGGPRWTGWGLLPAGLLAKLLTDAEGRADLERRVLATPGLHRLECVAPLTLSSAAEALGAAQALIRSGQPGGAVTQRQKGDGIWIGHGANVHPQATLVAPVYLGKNVLVREGARLGPDTVIEDGAVIENGAVVERSWVLAGTTVGQQLTLEHVIASGPRLINVEHDIVLKIADRLLLAGGDSSAFEVGTPSVLERFAARALWLLTWPDAALARRRLGITEVEAVADHGVGFPDRATDSFRARPTALYPTADEVRTEAPGAMTRHFARTFHPGLRDVWEGRVHLVGIEPRTVDEIAALPRHWQRLYATMPVGLINDSLLLGAESAEPRLAFAGDAIVAKGLSRGARLRLLLRYATAVRASLRIHGSGHSASATRP